MDLDDNEAIKRKIDGPLGFFLAELIDDAVFFAARRSSGTLLEVMISTTAMGGLLAAGSVRRPIPHGKMITFQGDELFIPPGAFPECNRRRARGELKLLPVRWP